MAVAVAAEEERSGVNENEWARRHARAHIGVHVLGVGQQMQAGPARGDGARVLASKQIGRAHV